MTKKLRLTSGGAFHPGRLPEEMLPDDGDMHRTCWNTRLDAINVVTHIVFITQHQVQPPGLYLDVDRLQAESRFYSGCSG